MNIFKLRRLERKINRRKEQGYTKLKIAKRNPEYLTSIEILWLKERTGCEIFELGRISDDGLYYILFEWE